MQPRLSFITLGVADIHRARDFYRDVLGWPLSSRSQAGVAFFQLNGFVLALYPADALARDAGLPAGVMTGVSRIALAYNVRARDEVDALLADLAAKGATITRPAADAFWDGRTGYFADPDGYLWEVAWNPGGYLDAAGNFRFEAS
jgi:hypothetical protein